MTDEPLTRPVASAAVEAAGWRLLLGAFAASVPVESLQQGLEVAAAAAAACAGDADEHLQLDLRPDRVDLLVRTRARTAVTGRDVQLAEQIGAAVHGLGRAFAAPTSEPGPRPVQLLELAIDALDIPAIRPFWLAVLGYVTEPGGAGPQAAIADPAGELPSLWFQQMDGPRLQRNRIHLDITVAHDEAPRRVQAALDAGGTLVSDEAAKAFWVLADAEGNEICVCTWQDRD
jgi:4a-hydroxytetrahydrobiopterin dehydratase